MILSPEPKTLTIYCYSGMQEVMENAIFPAFRKHWNAYHEERLEFIPTFAGSGAITSRVVAKFPAEVTILSSEIDAVSLSSRGIHFLQRKKELPFLGAIARTPLIMVVGDGNPKGLGDFGDLAGSDIEIACPDPLTSGAGQLGILALFGALKEDSANETSAFETLRAIWDNVIDPKANARDEREIFQKGIGDVLITYESHLLSNPKRARIPGQLIYPRTTVVSEPVVRIIKQNVKSGQMDLVNAFMSFLWSMEAQQAFVDYGFRSIDEDLNLTRDDFGTIENPLDLASFGPPYEIDRIIDRVISP